MRVIFFSSLLHVHESHLSVCVCTVCDDDQTLITDNSVLVSNHKTLLTLTSTNSRVPEENHSSSDVFF